MEFDFTEVPSEMIHSVLLETIENQLKSKPIHVELSSATKAGDHNFTGIIFRVSFKTEKETEDEHKIGSSLILKTAPQNIARRTQFSCRSAFTREIFTYDQVIAVISMHLNALTKKQTIENKVCCIQSK